MSSWPTIRRVLVKTTKCDRCDNKAVIMLGSQAKCKACTLVYEINFRRTARLPRGKP